MSNFVSLTRETLLDPISFERKILDSLRKNTTLDCGTGTLSRSLPDQIGVSILYLFIQHFHEIRLVISNELEIDVGGNEEQLLHHEYLRLLVSLAARCSGRALFYLVAAIPIEYPKPHPLDDVIGTPVVDSLSCDALIRGTKVDLSRWEHDCRLQAIRAKTKKDQYLPNFDVVELFKEEKKLTAIDTLSGRIRHGLQRCFRDSYKPRAGNMSQNLVQGLVAYRCSECVHYLDQKYNKRDHRLDGGNHICISHSGGVVVLVALMSPVHDFPFFFKLQGVVIHQEWTRCGANVPLVWWEVMELMSQTSTGSITSRMEWVLADFWVKRGADNLFGRTFINRDPFKNVREVILDRSDVLVYQVLGVTPVSTRGKWWSGTLTKVDESINAIMSEHPPTGNWCKHMTSGVTFNDRVARWVSVALQFWYGPMLYVTGATSLSLEQSAQVEVGSGPVLRNVVEEVNLDGTWFPVRHTYQDPIIQRIFLQEQEKLMRVPPIRGSLESKFLEEQTTNSSGIVDDVLAELKSELATKVGRENVHMITRVRQARIVDALIAIRDRFNNFESFKNGLDEIGKAGQRRQVNRRPRVIQMVRTCQQLIGFLVRLALKNLYSESRFASVGKNVGDVRDMLIALQISAEPGLKSSNDVKGMDMSTKKPQVDFNFELASMAFSGAINPGLSCFFYHCVEKGNRVTVSVRHGHEVESRQYTLCEYLICLGRKAFESRREFVDGFFQEHVETSAMGFPSGWYPTSDNHNEIGIATLEFIEHTLEELNLDEFGLRPSQVKINGAVAGDDQVLGVEIIGHTSSQVSKEVGQRVIDRLVDIMGRFGYTCDPSVSQHSAEFLKQVGVCGAPELFPSRLLLWTAERGDTANSHLIGQIQVQNAMLQEKVSRSPNSEGWLDYMIAGALTLGSATVFRNVEGIITRRVFVQGAGTGLAAGGKKVCYPGTVRRWCSGVKWSMTSLRGTSETFLVIPRFLWYVNHVQGIPPPPFRGILGGRFPGGSQYTIRSLSIFWAVLNALRKTVVEKDVIEDVTRRLSGPAGERVRDDMRRILRHLGYHDIAFQSNEALITIALSEVDRMPLDLEWFFRTDLLDRLNVCCGIFLSGELPLVHRDRIAKKERVFREWQETGNSLLDRGKHDRSYEAYEILRGRYGIEVPYAMVYFNRAGARIEQALEQVSTIVQERLEEDVDIVGLTQKDVSWERYRELFYCAWYDVVGNGGTKALRHPVILESGWGHVIPPDSEISWLVNACGLPDPGEDSKSGLSYRLSDELKLPGSVDLYVKYGKRCLRESRESYDLFLDAVGLSSQEGRRLEQYIKLQGQIYNMIPFAHNPRQTFFFNVTASGVSGHNLLLHDYRSIRKPTQMFRCMLFTSTIAMYPGMIRPHQLKSTVGGEVKVTGIETPQYNLVFSNALTAYLARVPRIRA
uniref:VP1 protein n=1 Tax=Calla Lily Valley virus TaxID=3139873 RepID=A0AAN0LIP2_9VIRU